MKDEATVKKSRTGCVLLVLLVGVPALLCGGGGSWWLGRNALAERELQDKLRELRLQGLPVDNPSMQIYYEQLTDKRHASEWLAIIESLKQSEASGRTSGLPVLGNGPEVPPPDQPWPEQQAVQQFLEEMQPTLESVHRVAQFGESVQYPRRFESFNTELPSVQGLRDVARLLTLEHALALRDGDAASDAQSIDSTLGTALSMRNDPVMISQLVLVAIHSIAVTNLQESLQYGHFDSDQLQRLYDRLELFRSFREPFLQSLAGERGMALPVFRDPELLGDQSVPGFSRSIDALRYLEEMESLQSIRTDTLQNFVRDGERWGTNFDQRLEDAGVLERIDTLLTSLTFPALSAYINAIARQQMANRLAQLAIAIRQFERQQGRLPNSLDELQEGGVDLQRMRPIEGDQFGYRLDDANAVLWGYNPRMWSSTASGNSNKNQPIDVPADPPPIEGSPEAEQNRPWVWVLPRWSEPQAESASEETAAGEAADGA